MKNRCLGLLLLACKIGAATAEDTAAAMAKLNAVLPRAAEQYLALSAAPAHLRAAASVYIYGNDGYERVRTGHNGFTCLVNRDAFFYASSVFKPTCWDAEGEKTYLPVMLAVGNMLAAGKSFAAIDSAIDAAFANGSFRVPQNGGIAYMLAGDVELDTATGKVIRQAFPGHYMFYARGITEKQLGSAPESAKTGPMLPSVFDEGAGGRHGLSYVIVVPAEASRR